MTFLSAEVNEGDSMTRRLEGSESNVDLEVDIANQAKKEDNLGFDDGSRT